MTTPLLALFACPKPLPDEAPEKLLLPLSDPLENLLFKAAWSCPLFPAENPFPVGADACCGLNPLSKAAPVEIEDPLVPNEAESV